MRFILVGPPGAGKGTQAAGLAAHFSIPHISTGDMLRAEVADGTELGLRIQDLLARGELAPDALVLAVVDHRLNKPDCKNGFLLDGFPRTQSQAEALDSLLTSEGLSLDCVILLEAPEEEIVQRITGRRQDPVTGAIYHLKYNPPPKEIVPRLVQRDDDNERTCRDRLKRYRDETEAVIPHYQRRGLLKRVEGLGSRQEVFGRIVAALTSA